METKEIIKRIEAAVKEVLKPHGFKKKGNTWYLDMTDTVGVVNLQKSSWGNQFYMNVCISVRRLNPSGTPAENQCQIRVRLEDIAGRPQALTQAFDFDIQPERADLHEDVIADAVRGTAVPWLKQMATLDGVGKMISQPSASKWDVWSNVKALVGVSSN